MYTLYYVVTDEPTYPLRHSLKAAGLRWDTARKQWWAQSESYARTGAGIVSGSASVVAVQADALPRFKPRGRPFRKGADQRRDASASDAAYSRNGASAATATEDDDTETHTEDNYAEEAAEATEYTHAASADTSDAAAQLAALVKALAGGAVDANAVRRLVAEATKDLRAKVDSLQGWEAPTRVVVERPNVEARDCGVQHKHFPLLLKACNARTGDGHRLNVWLVGPAGTGKTRAASEVATALDLPFWSNGALASKYELLGFADANGKTHRTPFREAWERGGVFLWDEIDGSDNNAVLAFNQGLANGVIPFPDGMVPRHTDCIVIAGANSASGGTANYNGRIRQDGAFLDRFVYLDWPLDEALERAIAPDAAWCKRVQAVRRNVTDRGVQGHLVTPRATLYGAALLAAGLDKDTVETMVLRKALSDEQWAQVRGSN